MTNFEGHKLFTEPNLIFKPNQRIKSYEADAVLEFYALDSIPKWWYKLSYYHFEKFCAEEKTRRIRIDDNRKDRKARADHAKARKLQSTLELIRKMQNAEDSTNPGLAELIALAASLASDADDRVHPVTLVGNPRWYQLAYWFPSRIPLSYRFTWKAQGGEADRVHQGQA